MEVNETFLSLQGEGSQVGSLTFIVRLSGCNLRCSYCDTTYAYDEGANISVDSIVKKAEESGINNVCITGGEPLLQKEIDKLAKTLLNKGYSIDLETNGSIMLPSWTKNKNVIVALDIKCPSSGMSDKMLLDNLNHLSEKDFVKFVIGSSEDYEFAKNISAGVKKAKIFFQPVYGKYELKNLAGKIIDDKLTYVNLGIQLHKIIWDPNTRGV